MSLKTLFAATAFALACSTAALAQEAMDHSAHGATEVMAPKGDTGPSSTAFAEANARMHKDMDIAYSGNADIDFVRGMIAHHQGAIDMARIELQYGKDDAIRTLAGQVIAAQEGEIKMMKEWLARNGG